MLPADGETERPRNELAAATGFGVCGRRQEHSEASGSDSGGKDTPHLSAP
jgi:hypothetical protein